MSEVLLGLPEKLEGFYCCANKVYIFGHILPTLQSQRTFCILDGTVIVIVPIEILITLSETKKIEKNISIIRLAQIEPAFDVCRLSWSDQVRPYIT